MQSAIPQNWCSRVRVLLHKSASFKTIFDKSLTNHKKDAKTYPKMIDTSIEKQWINYAETYRMKLPKKHLSMLAPILNNLQSSFLGLRVCCATCFSEPLGAYPLGMVLASLRHPWYDFLDLGEDSRSKSAPLFKKYRATNGTNHTFKKRSKD